MNIPKIIHQTWKTSHVPEQFQSFVDSWKTKNPDYEYKLWTDKDNEEFVEKHFGYLHMMYKHIPKPIMKTDLIRYLILYVHGGFYIDLDMECFKPLDELKTMYPKKKVLLTEEHPQHGQEFGMDTIVTNWFMACEPEHPFFKNLINSVTKSLIEKLTRPETQDILKQTGPFKVTEVYLSYLKTKDTHDKTVFLLDHKFYNPVPKQIMWHDSLYIDKHYKIKKVDSCFGCHYYVGTWWKKEALPRTESERQLVYETSKPLFTIVTPTIGRTSLLRLKESLRAEKVPYVHFIMWDHKRCEDSLSPQSLEDDRTFCYEMKHELIQDRVSNSRADVILRAIGISMARTKYIRCMDDDTMMAKNHLEDIYKHMEENKLDFTWNLRKMITRDYEEIGYDVEAVGYQNKYGYHLLDNSSTSYNQKAGNILCQVYQSMPVYGEDRHTWKPLMSHCKGKILKKVLTIHSAQPHLERFFKQHCIKDYDEFIKYINQSDHTT
jgi:hypothetical protein